MPSTFEPGADGHDPLADPQRRLERGASALEPGAGGCWWWKEDALRAAISRGLLGEHEPLALMYNLTAYRAQMAAVRAAFPPHWVHAMAVKSNNVLPLMRLAEREGIGFEAASMGELHQSLRACADPARIVFDSPVKRRTELDAAVRAGVYINVDNLQELGVLAEVLEQLRADGAAHPRPRVGVRLNPQVGTGSMHIFSTAGASSKFGVGHDQREEILAAFGAHEWLSGVHVHVGSQGIAPQLHVQGVRRAVDLALEVNRRHGTPTRPRIAFVDIGGGLSVNFDSEADALGDSAVPFAEYARLLREGVPELFSGEFTVLTEFGRRYNAKPGFFAARVEYNKSAGGRNVAAIHGGADLFTRYVWEPANWRMRVSVCDADGRLRAEDEPRPRQDLAGPCCIAGDVVAHRRAMPLARRGDYALLHDQGSYAISGFCFYNSRQLPPILGFEEADVHGTLRVLKRGVTVEETMAFFE